MDDSRFGSTTKRGDWRPKDRLEYPPVFVWPPRPIKLLTWIFKWDGYVVPWNVVYVALAVLIWLYATPSAEAITSGDYSWLLMVLLRNYALVLGWYGSWHLWLYVKRAQGTRFKFNVNWPNAKNAVFLFGRQTLDNMIWTLLSGVPIWSAYECGMLWLFANHAIPVVEFAANPVYFIALLALIPFWLDLHFYLVHRALHWPPLYKYVHSLHHNYVNPGPWSGLSMHPFEHIVYFSSALLFIVVPANPLLVIFALMRSGIGPAQSHAGFDKIVVGSEQTLDPHGYDHYLHHKYFECNYGGGPIPLDKWFGTFHDGSDEAQQAMDKRFLERARRSRKSKSADIGPEAS